VHSKFRNAGQTCICTNRIYVQEEAAERFIELFKQELSKLNVGNGLEKDVGIGPLIDQAAVDKVKSLIEDALMKGAEIVYTGNVPESKEGNYYPPTIVANVKDDMLCVSEEIFGPLAPISTFKT
jgi:succinate-semialdehyde dehydrogenase/glutarate-semialdehyde dehydrogenase